MEKIIEQLQSDLAASKKEAAENLELANLAQKKCEETEKELADLKAKSAESCCADCAENEKLKDELSILKDFNRELRAELAAKKSPGAKETFELEGAKYEVLSATYIQGMGKLSAIEIASDQKAQRFLIAKNSGVIREIK